MGRDLEAQHKSEQQRGLCEQDASQKYDKICYIHRIA